MGTIRGAASVLVVPIGSMQDYEGDIPGNGIIQESGLTWLLLDGATIGSASSGAARYATDKARELFKKLWNNVNLVIFTNTGVPSTRGATADADFDAGKRLSLPDPRGRAVISAGQGSGLTNRARGQTGGAETHTMSTGEMPTHGHGAYHNNEVYKLGAGGAGENVSLNPTYYGFNAGTDLQGSGNAHNIMQPYYVTGGKLILAGRV
ncbi:MULTISPECIES: phage tail protein [Trichocoleus]|uniref:Tail fiber protein n=1 Tax=Trichocoleus desertorum GB2-A4 TaxID=2933944 RepID=A0ABV0JD00_9CYAN|nr:hypothetical protein [Trichocoleus sp. FACHB-46]MBD1864176.1 hypothetical protein [Trichocoleus sp. FACHB-46]